MQKNILVCGGAGYIGSTVVDHLLHAGYAVVVLDALSSGHAQHVPQDALFIQGSIGEVDLVRQILHEQNISAVMQFAASIEAGESMKDPHAFFMNNVVQTEALLHAMQLENVDQLIFSSTAAVYASQDRPISEQDEISPANFYGQTKRHVEELLAWYHRIHGLRACIFRYFNACGASTAFSDTPVRGEAHQPESHLIPLILQVAKGEREQISIYGTDYPTDDGTCIRDYIHVDDLATAHLAGLQALEAGSFDLDVFNVGTGSGYSVRQVVNMVRQVTGKEIPAVEVERRPGDAAILVAAVDKIHQQLGWKATKSSLEHVIQTAWQWDQKYF